MKKIMSPSEKTTQTQQTPHNTATAWSWSHMKPADEATIPALLLVYLLRISALGPRITNPYNGGAQMYLGC